MGEGNYCDAIQAVGATGMKEDEAVCGVAVGEFDDNRQWIRLAQSGNAEESERACSHLIQANLGLVRSIALRFRERGVDFEDLMQIGTIGMLRAIRSFDLERGTCFSTYAVPLIFGELRRHMRDEGPIKVGRTFKKLGAALMSEKNRILLEEGREPHISELAVCCGVSPEEAAMALESLSPMVSLSEYAFGEEEGVELEAILPDEDSSGEIDRLCSRIALSQAIGKMPSLWQKIVVFRYYRNLTQQQTADHLGLSQVKVSREEKKILEFLRGEMLPK